MINKISTALAFVFLVLPISCSVLTPQADFAPAVLAHTYPPRTPADKVGLFRTQMPAKKYSEIGSVRACCRMTSNEIIDVLRKKAADVGGDALIALEIDANGAATASVIRYDEP